ncbi:hypothetical protein [Nitrosospira multiformis]|nr:hypothetical protein [Nitrosospira multiformis]
MRETDTFLRDPCSFSEILDSNNSMLGLGLLSVVSEDEARDFDAETKNEEKCADPDIFRREEHQYSA